MTTPEADDSLQFLSRRMRSIPPSGIRKFFDLIAETDDVISLGIGEPSEVTPRPFIDAAIQSLNAGNTRYTSNWGMSRLREDLAAHIERLYGLRYDPQTEILITSGSSEGLDIALRSLLDDGDEVLCADPSYVAYEPATLMAGGRFRGVPTHVENDFRLAGSELDDRATARSKVLLLGYPTNPTGATLGREDLLAIAEVVKRRNLAVVSDELYDRLTYGQTHVSFPTLPGMRERTVLVGGFSKAYAMTGWRLGWVCAPAGMAEMLMRVHQYVMMSAPTMSQAAGIAALELGEPYVEAMRTEYDRRRKLIVGGLRSLGLATFEPRGAFYAFPDIRSTGLTSAQFSEGLLTEERVAVVPGDAFGPSGEGFVRCCYATSYEDIERALERMGRFVARRR
ncbi:MAG: pyridoxal phosphate-dependent aminotransferase [Dehalococcoidia bacterium]